MKLLRALSKRLTACLSGRCSWLARCVCGAASLGRRSARGGLLRFWWAWLGAGPTCLGCSVSSDFAHHMACDCGACDRAKYVPVVQDAMWLLALKAAGWCLLAGVCLPFLFVGAVGAWFMRRRRVDGVKDARGWYSHG